MPDLAQPGWPLRFITLPDGTTQFATVIQDSDQDREASAAVIISTPKGWRDDEPAFGITPLVGQTGPIDTDRLASELAQSDPRLADVTAAETVNLLRATDRVVRVDVGRDTEAN